MSLRHPVPAVQLYLWHVSYLLPLSQGQGTRVPSRTRAVSLVRSLARSYPHSPSPPTFISCPFVLVLYLSSAHLLSPTLTLSSHLHFVPTPSIAPPLSHSHTFAFSFIAPSLAFASIDSHVRIRSFHTYTHVYSRTHLPFHVHDVVCKFLKYDHPCVFYVNIDAIFGLLSIHVFVCSIDAFFVFLSNSAGGEARL